MHPAGETRGDSGEARGDGRTSVAFPRQWWYPACRARDLGRKRPRSITLMDTPIVLFRDGTGYPRALLDRCPHRNMPLSLGRVAGDGCVECCYHGWRFDGQGTCRAVPGLYEGDAAAAANRSVAFHATRERHGMVWVWGEPGVEPASEPFAFPEFEAGPGTGEVVFDYDLECTMHAALENALDVPHTAFLHRGIFRGSAPREITAVRRDVPDGVEVEYLGEPVGFGRFQPPGGETTFDHWDRFFLPGIAQIEYRVEGWLRIVNTIVHLPLSPLRTRAWFVVQYWTRFPAAVVKPIVLARGKQILRQDAEALKHQAETVTRFGGERYTSTAIDFMGAPIWRLLRQAERAEHTGNGAGEASGDEASGPDEPVIFTI